MLVSLIVPAHNAAHTIERTLQSARGQTHQALEIIVVDDASTDATAAMVARHAAADPRVRLVSSAVNRGVGGARNLGAAEAKGDVFCFLDADDLLAPCAVEARLKRMDETGAQLCYAWSAIIDADDMIIHIPHRAVLNGQAFEDLALHGNVLRNGSSILVTRRAFEAVGGYCEALFAAGCQGCEDYKFYLDVARDFPFACCEEVLIGYRQLDDNMSSNSERMLGSFQLVQADLLARDPGIAPLVSRARSQYLLHTGLTCLRRGQYGVGLRYLSMMRTGLVSGLLRSARAAIRRNLASATASPAAPKTRFPYTSAS